MLRTVDESCFDSTALLLFLLKLMLLTLLLATPVQSSCRRGPFRHLQLSFWRRHLFLTLSPSCFFRFNEKTRMMN